jgi:hypothetical protein
MVITVPFEYLKTRLEAMKCISVCCGMNLLTSSNHVDGDGRDALTGTIDIPSLPVLNLSLACLL